MIDVVKATTWPLPEGGEAEVHSGLGFDPPSDVRPPSQWGAERVALALGPKAKDVNACKRHGAGTFHVTAYVGPAPKPPHNAGLVLTAGAAAPGAPAAEDLDCLLGVVRRMQLPSPGSYPVKVSFPL